MKPTTDPKPKSTHTSREQFYESLKNNIINDEDDMTSDENVDVVDKDTSMQKIKTLNNIVENSAVRSIKSYYMLGLELANLKYMYYVELCSRCQESDDKYDALFCVCCPHLPSNSVGTKEFFKFCNDNLSKSSKPWINFLIKVGKLGTQYPEFRNVNISMYELKKHISWLPSCIERDSEFWK